MPYTYYRRFLNDGGGGGGAIAKLSLIIGQSLARSISTVMKIDRVTGKYLITNLDETENFVGTGSKYIYDLQWSMDMKSYKCICENSWRRIIKKLQYKYENILDTNKGYDRYKGRITLTLSDNLSAIVVTYKKEISLLHAQDRINQYMIPNRTI